MTTSLKLVCPVWDESVPKDKMMPIPSAFSVNLNGTKQEEVSYNVVEEICILGLGRRIVWKTIDGIVPSM